jgi:uncharacterized protein (TIGR00725 family)
MAKTIIGVMGPGSKPTEQDLQNAYAIGKFSAQNGWTILTGGSKAGVMHAALKGAKDGNGETIGILPSYYKSAASEYVDHIIVTGMGSARNNINILSSDVVVACGVEAGTLSEIALALKAGKIVILLTQNLKAIDFLKDLAPKQIFVADTIDTAASALTKLLKNDQS